MNLNFFDPKCITASNKKLFGLCDDAHPAKKPAYIDETNGTKWLAVVVNEDANNVLFVAVDNCIELLKADDNLDKRCDGFLCYNNTIIFVELKDRKAIGNEWVKDAERQLKTTISYYEKANESANFSTKKAYIANKGYPKYKESQRNRMEQFQIDTGYTLRIENRIIL